MLEAIRIGQIQSKPSSGPEVGADHRIVEDDGPPLETPRLRAFRPLAGPTDEATDVVGELPRAE